MRRLSTEKPLCVYGFTERISLLMDAADAVITKPGGITVSEALAKRLPLILTEGIPGIEARNAELLLNSDVAIRLSDAYGIEAAVSQLFMDNVRLSAMQSCIDRIRCPNAAISLARFIETCVTE
jgi:processive 1,2-diacylglycerol beta-glucosyltransferase